MRTEPPLPSPPLPAALALHNPAPPRPPRPGRRPGPPRPALGPRCHGGCAARRRRRRVGGGAGHGAGAARRPLGGRCRRARGAGRSKGRHSGSRGGAVRVWSEGARSDIKRCSPSPDRPVPSGPGWKGAAPDQGLGPRGLTWTRRARSASRVKGSSLLTWIERVHAASPSRFRGLIWIQRVHSGLRDPICIKGSRGLIWIRKVHLGSRGLLWIKVPPPVYLGIQFGSRALMWIRRAHSGSRDPRGLTWIKRIHLGLPLHPGVQSGSRGLMRIHRLRPPRKVQELLSPLSSRADRRSPDAGPCLPCQAGPSLHPTCLGGSLPLPSQPCLAWKQRGSQLGRRPGEDMAEIKAF